MNNSSDPEYIFWLSSWRDTSTHWLKHGHFKCILTKEKLRIVPTENDPDRGLNLELSYIQDCKIYHLPKNPNCGIKLILSDREIMLFPIHPFDPSPVIFIPYTNENETFTLKTVIDAFRSNVDFEINANPYFRQLATKDDLKRYKILDLQWDANTSPWDYYDLYGDKFLWLKTIGVIMASVVIVVAVLLAVAYVLDSLDII